MSSCCTPQQGFKRRPDKHAGCWQCMRRRIPQVLHLWPPTAGIRRLPALLDCLLLRLEWPDCCLPATLGMPCTRQQESLRKCRESWHELPGYTLHIMYLHLPTRASQTPVQAQRMHIQIMQQSPTHERKSCPCWSHHTLLESELCSGVS